MNMDIFDPVLQIQLDAAARRDVLAAQWFRAAQIEEMLVPNSSSGNNVATKLRRQGGLLAVYLAHPVPSYRYPPWQLRADGQPVEHLAEILKVLRDCGPFEREPGGMSRTTGWGEVEWFLSPHALLYGARPAEVLAIDSARVLQVARTEFIDEA